MKKNIFTKLGLIALVLLLQACTTTEHRAKPSLSKPATVEKKKSEPDGPPLVDRDVESIPDAEPMHEPYSKYGNPQTYSALGKRYYTVSHSKGYDAKGKASWYGRKFHGQRTSSGEPYDMFAMTAAHRSLPLPTYAKVKNLDNNKEIIVKINDRGPFHHERLIDLSYAAAKKLGIHAKGTGHVHVTAIDPIAWHNQKKKLQLAKNVENKNKANKSRTTKKQPTQLAQNTVKTKTAPNREKTNKHIYVQLGSFEKKLNAQKLADKAITLSQVLKSDVHVYPSKLSNKELYKVRIGPLKNKEEANKLQKQLVAVSTSNPATIIFE